MPSAAMQSAKVSCWQVIAPLLTTQHAPVGGVGAHVVLEQIVPTPWKVPLAAVQPDSVRYWQSDAPVGLGTQHAPSGGLGGQVMTAHEEFAPCHVPLKFAHSASVRNWHAGKPEFVGRQHAPRGEGVGQMPAVLQVVPTPRKTPLLARHWVSVVLTQKAPLGLVTQHAPVCGGVQMLGMVHEVPLPRKVPPAVVQACWVSCWQVIAPPAMMQHAPVGVEVGHEVAVHTLPAPRQTPFCDAHMVSVTMMQIVPPLGPVTQQAPGRSCAWARGAATSAANPRARTVQHFVSLFSMTGLLQGRW
jgi:hypothetical protein